MFSFLGSEHMYGARAQVCECKGLGLSHEWFRYFLLGERKGERICFIVEKSRGFVVDVAKLRFSSCE